MKKFWKSKEDRENNPQSVASSKREFPTDNFDQLNEKEQGISRRNFFKLMGSSVVLAGATGCSNIRKPERKIYPYVRMPESLVPGNSIFYATTHQHREEVSGLLVENHEGRPTKIEGNPLHPNSGGATSAFQQASVLDLYDPDRFESPIVDGRKATDSKKVLSDWVSKAGLAENKGRGAAILAQYSMSPTYNQLLVDLQRKYPELKIYRHEAVNNDNVYQGNYQMSGRWTMPVVDYSRANVVVSLNSDFLGLESGSLRANQDFMKKRRVENGSSNRLYQFENTFSLTGGVADHRFRIKRSEIDLIAYSILRQFYKKGVFRTNKFLISRLEKSLIDSAEILRDNPAYNNVPVISDDLSSNLGRAVVVAGAGASPLVHSLVFYINILIKAPVSYYLHPFADYDFIRRNSVDSIKELAVGLESGNVENLIILGGDPVYSTPSGLNLTSLIKKSNALSLADIPSETTAVSSAVIPRTHYLEGWSDLLSVAGVYSLVQPQINKLNDSLSEIEVLSSLLSEDGGEVSDVVKGVFVGKMGQSAANWEKALHDGVAANLGSKYRRLPELVNVDQFASRNEGRFIVSNRDLEVTFDPDYSVFDGRFINNSWLQELPDPVTKIVWDNVIMVSHSFAEKEGLKTYDAVELSLSAKKVSGVIWVTPGQEELSISVRYGYGQKATGKVGVGSGFSAYELKELDGRDVEQGNISISKLGRTEKIASVQDHWNVDDEIFEGKPSSNSQNGRPLFRQGSLEDYKKNPNFAKDMVEVPHLSEYHDRVGQNKKDHSMYAENMSIFNEMQYTAEYQWGMAIDLSTCTGCNVCTIACQAENTIPVVGKEMVLKGREMHWIRIDRYFEGDPVDPQMVAQPMTCLQCEQAPCEQVCPVAATVHSEEGLNDMVYNRCIGTRFCSNNCPVKVRRYNYFDFHQRSPHAKKRISSHIFELFKEPDEALQLQFNPDVSVRMRGVMEKCTYCVQRINRARVVARNEDRKIRDGEIKVACEQACPSGSIVFGNIRDEDSKVSKAKKQGRDYHVLAELNIKPRTSYLASIRNPNKRIKV